jgi:DNA-binding Lrp family transcriptional regulator
MVAVQLGTESRAATQSFAQATAQATGVVNVYFVSGSYDFLVQVAMPNVEALRAFVVDTLSSRPEVASTETHLIFEHVRGHTPLAAQRPAAPSR